MPKPTEAEAAEERWRSRGDGTGNPGRLAGAIAIILAGLIGIPLLFMTCVWVIRWIIRG